MFEIFIYITVIEMVQTTRCQQVSKHYMKINPNVKLERRCLILMYRYSGYDFSIALLFLPVHFVIPNRIFLRNLNKIREYAHGTCLQSLASLSVAAVLLVSRPGVNYNYNTLLCFYFGKTFLKDKSIFVEPNLFEN